MKKGPVNLGTFWGIPPDFHERARKGFALCAAGMPRRIIAKLEEVDIKAETLWQYLILATARRQDNRDDLPEVEHTAGNDEQLQWQACFEGFPKEWDVTQEQWDELEASLIPRRKRNFSQKLHLRDPLSLEKLAVQASKILAPRKVTISDDGHVSTHA